MVDYRGPFVVRSFCEAWNLSLFRRVTQIAYAYEDAGLVHLEKTDVAALRKLETISIASFGEQANSKQAIAKLKEIVPPCRLESVEQTADTIQADLNVSALCCSQ